MCKEKTLVCPNCKSKDIADDSIRANNGKLGVGFKSWILKIQYSCNKCGTIFKDIEK